MASATRRERLLEELVHAQDAEQVALIKEKLQLLNEQNE